MSLSYNNWLLEVNRETGAKRLRNTETGEIRTDPESAWIVEQNVETGQMRIRNLLTDDIEGVAEEGEKEEVYH